MTFQVSIEHLLATNCAPSPHEVAIIKHLSTELDDKLKYVGLEIVRVHAMLEHLEYVRRTIVQRKAAHMSILSSVRRVPLELWGEILYFALPSIVSKEGRIALQTYCSVCCDWRRAAYSTPKLWAVLEINVHKFRPVGEFEMNAVTWLKRSGTLPVTFTLNVFGVDPEEGLHVANAIPDKHRWKNFSFNASHERSFLPLFGSSSDCCWDMLEELQLFASSIEAPPALENDYINLLRASRLRKLSLSFLQRIHIDVLRVPWLQLTHLSLTTETTSQEHLEILQECVNLEECEVALRADEDVAPIPAATGIVHMPKLRRLGIWAAHNLAPFLSHVQTPVMEEFLIDLEIPCSGADFEATIMEFIHRSECRVKKLTLREPPLHDAALFSFLIRFDFLVELHIKHLEMNGSVFKHLRRSVCIPDLEIIDVEVGEPFSRTDFVRFLQSRYWSDEGARSTKIAVQNRFSCIRTAALTYDEQYVDLPLKVVEELRNKGLDVKFQHF